MTFQLILNPKVKDSFAIITIVVCLTTLLFDLDFQGQSLFSPCRLRIAEDELISLRAKVGLIDDYERQIRRLKDEVFILTGHKERLSTPVIPSTYTTR